jgi:hypothetical protein
MPRAQLVKSLLCLFLALVSTHASVVAAEATWAEIGSFARYDYTSGVGSETIGQGWQQYTITGTSGGSLLVEHRIVLTYTIQVPGYPPSEDATVVYSVNPETGDSYYSDGGYAGKEGTFWINVPSSAATEYVSTGMGTRLAYRIDSPSVNSAGQNEYSTDWYDAGTGLLLKFQYQNQANGIWSRLVISSSNIIGKSYSLAVQGGRLAVGTVSGILSELAGRAIVGPVGLGLTKSIAGGAGAFFLPAFVGSLLSSVANLALEGIIPDYNVRFVASTVIGLVLTALIFGVAFPVSLPALGVALVAFGLGQAVSYWLGLY